jgi:hypothetical protein
MRKNIKLILVIAFLLSMFFLVSFVLANAPAWQGTSVNYSVLEDTPYYHNLRNNISGYGGSGVTFVINTLQTNITWTNASGVYNVTKESVSGWISITNSTLGNLSINAVYDNQTGFFTIPIEAKNITDDAATTEVLEFMINATNDAPQFLNINATYNMSALSPLFAYLNANDEESQYPITFNLSIVNNCTLASWSTRGAGNCSIFSLTNQQNTSALMNFTPTNNDAGIYWANVTIMDAGQNYPCPHSYCVNANYQQNKTTSYAFVVFNVFSALSVDTSNCANKIFQENQNDWCIINITTKGAADTLNISSYSLLRNYGSGQANVFNTSWFYPTTQVNSSGFTKTVNVSVRPQKTEDGNWTINFTVSDLTHNESSYTPIYIYVNRTVNHVPFLANLNNLITSINLETLINLTAYDNDTLIPDKNATAGGFNESITFNTVILNRSNLNQQLSLSNFSVRVLNMPVVGTNITTAEIRFTLNSNNDAGNYTINLTATDHDGAMDFKTFNLTVINDTAPSWTSPLNTTFLIWEGNNTSTDFSRNVTDINGDTLTFSYSNDTLFPSFNLNSVTGVLNFVAVDEDVGQHIVNITVSDGYLTSTTSFNFTIYNIEDFPIIKPLQATNITPSSITNGSWANATEDNYTTILLWIDDDDIKIPSGQKSFYNESFGVNLTIQGINSSLFNFVKTSSFPTPGTYANRTEYQAVFTPRKADIGNYSITLNVTDASNYSTYIIFNLSIAPIDHNPVLSNLSNKTSAVNRNLVYNINVTDIEDGTDTGPVNSNFTFSYNFLSGTDFINNNHSIFNITTGILNITFNSSQSGTYRLNISVNDSSGRTDLKDFWIFVYSTPTINFPSAGAIFNLTENSTYLLNFSANHSVGDNLTFDFYLDSISYDGSNFNYGNSTLNYSISYYGNNTNLSWLFSPNLIDEGYGKFRNLTLVVYPSASDLANNADVNTTANFKLNISHLNSPVIFSGHIADMGPTAYTDQITVDLTPYFSDLDHSDSYYNQTVNLVLNTNDSSITSSISSAWLLTVASSKALTALVSVTGDDGSSNATSNYFLVQFVEPTTVSVVTSGGGSSTREVPVSLKIIMPDPVSAYQKDRIVLPLTLYNDGKVNLNGITLNATVAKNGSIIKDINISFSQNYFSSLASGQKQNLTMVADVNTDEEGTYEITVNAQVKDPAYFDWGKMFLTIKKGESVREKLVFTEEFIVSNPECLELMETINEAKSYLAQGNDQMALEKADEALSACRDAVAQPGKSKIQQVVENKLYRYLIISTLIVFFVGISFYSYKRMKLRRRRGNFIQESIKNKQYLTL